MKDKEPDQTPDANENPEERFKLSVNELNARAEYWDKHLQELAIYKLSSGMTCHIEDPNEILKTFAEYKNLIRNGEFTYQQLFFDVVKDHSVLLPIPDTTLEALKGPVGFYQDPKEVFPNLSIVKDPNDKEDRDTKSD